MIALLDGSVLAALTITEHEHHDRAGRWFAGLEGFAVCPITETALLRFFLRLGESPQTALAVLEGIREHPRCQFWAAELSSTELSADTIGSADQLTDSYLAALAESKGGQLATLEEETSQRLGAILIPA